MKKLLSFGGIMAAMALFITFFSGPVNAATTWNTTGNYVINMNLLGTDYPHNMSLTQNTFGNLSGSGTTTSGTSTYTWVIESGTVVGDSIHLTANYTAMADAVTPQTVLTMTGMLAQNGTISGTWSDNYRGVQRTGNFSTVSGRATTTATTTPPTTATTTPPTTATSTATTTPVTGVVSTSTSKVITVGYVDGKMATAMAANNSDFKMLATFMKNGATGTAQYALSKNGYNNDTTPYKAQSPQYPHGSSYSTHLIMDNVVGATCATGMTRYDLAGYTYGNTMEEALNATATLVAPSFTNMNHDKYVIVWMDDCTTDGRIEGHVTGNHNNGILAVTSMEAVDVSSTANGTFEDGWKYVFSITLPSNETNLSMKFADWIKNGSASSTIAASNNMRISSPQANNSGAKVLITAANAYATPALTMVTDLNPDLAGIQVKVVVEVKIPTTTANGTYTTNYGIKSE